MTGPEDRADRLRETRNLKMARSAHTYVRGSTVKFYEGLWQAPAAPVAVLALAHGAGAGMAHRSMAAIADGLADLGVATLRYQFPYMEKGGKRPDSPAVAHAAVTLPPA